MKIIFEIISVTLYLTRMAHVTEAIWPWHVTLLSLYWFVVGIGRENVVMFSANYRSGTSWDVPWANCIYYRVDFYWKYITFWRECAVEKPIQSLCNGKIKKKYNIFTQFLHCQKYYSSYQSIRKSILWLFPHTY